MNVRTIIWNKQNIIYYANKIVDVYSVHFARDLF